MGIVAEDYPMRFENYAAELHQKPKPQSMKFTKTFDVEKSSQFKDVGNSST
jgi:hypothetical protein